VNIPHNQPARALIIKYVLNMIVGTRFSPTDEIRTTSLTLFGTAESTKDFAILKTQIINNTSNAAKISKLATIYGCHLWILTYLAVTQNCPLVMRSREEPTEIR
jgi:hypothetical protein